MNLIGGFGVVIAVAMGLLQKERRPLEPGLHNVLWTVLDLRASVGGLPSRMGARSVALPEQSISTIRRKSRRSNDDPASLIHELRPGALAVTTGDVVPGRMV